MREDHGEQILKTSQPKGQSGLPLAAEMILRAIAEQVTTLAEQQMTNKDVNIHFQDPHSEQLIEIFTDFSGKLKKYFADVQETSQLNRSVDSQWLQTAQRMRELVQFQRNFNTKLQSKATALTGHVKRHTGAADMISQVTRFAESLSSGFQKLAERRKEFENSFPRMSETCAVLLQRFESLGTDYTDLVVELNNLRAGENKSLTLWQTLSASTHRKSSSLAELVEINESLRAAARLLQLLSVNTGIEAAKSDSQDSGLSFIAADLKVVAEQISLAQRNFAQRLAVLREETDEFATACDQIAHRFQSTTHPPLSARHEASVQPTTLDRSAIFSEIRNTLAKLKLNLSDLAKPEPIFEQEVQTIVKNLRDCQSLASKETSDLKTLVQSFEAVVKEAPLHENLVDTVKQEFETLKVVRNRLAEALHWLVSTADTLESQRESLAASVDNGLTNMQPISLENEQVAEIKEQLKQCAQEIFSLVDTPDRSHRAAS